MPEEKADEMVADEALRCAHCDEPIAEAGSHIKETGLTDTTGVFNEWICIEPNWKERAKKAEAELTACYNEIFWTVPEAMPLIDKIKTMHGMESDVLVRLAAVQKELDELKGKKKLKEPKLKVEVIDPDLGDHMTWADFLKHIEDGSISDDDGCADLATDTQVSNISVNCSGAKDFKKPDWATHVIWYNK